MPDVAMPRLSDSMEEGTILKWLKADGDEVAKGEELVEIETDKATMTYEADAEGTLSIVADEGSTLAIGEVIARIGEGDGASAGAGAEGRSEQEAGGGDGDGDGGASTATAEREDGGDEAAAEADGEGGDGEDATAEGDAGEGEEESAKGDTGEGDEESADGEGDEESAEAPSAEADADEASAEADDDDEDTPDRDEGRPGEQTTAAEDAPPADGNGGRPKASPVARRIARERGVDLSGLEGSGPGGRIVKADVEAAASGGADKAEAAQPQKGRAEPAEAEPEAAEEAKPEKAAGREPAPSGDAQTGRGEVTVHEPTRIQQLIARRMAESKATIPHFTLSTDVDMEAAVELRARLKELSEAQDKPAPSYNDMVVKASASALRDFPLANGAYRDGHFELYGRVNIGVAVAADESLVVPTIFDADRKGLGQIAKESRALAEKVRDGRITPPELSGGTFSITNLGMYGVEYFTAVINPPQAAILAVGKLEQRPVVHDGEVVARSRMTLTISCDHRILYGAPAALFLARIKAILEQPIALAL
jgi:pyruvate dehydrogenase E2 component (dihydrolipoamide acetyltransferase)